MCMCVLCEVYPDDYPSWVCAPGLTAHIGPDLTPHMIRITKVAATHLKIHPLHDADSATCAAVDVKRAIIAAY